jgi:hypothetical protein
LQEAGLSAKGYPAEGKTHDTINADLGLPDDKSPATWTGPQLAAFSSATKPANRSRLMTSSNACFVCE